MNALLLSLLLVFAVGDYTPTSDGAPNDENLPATFAANRVVGDIYPQGADLPFQRLVDTVTGAGLFTTNSDPSVVGVDPLTGEDAPVGTDVGFGAAVARGLLTNVMNGDFAIPPADADAAITAANPLPYWTWTPGVTGQEAYSQVNTNAGSGRNLYISRVTGSATYGSLKQLVRVPSSAGQQYRVVFSMWEEDTYGASTPSEVDLQFYRADAVTTTGALRTRQVVPGFEAKADLGLVPDDARYLLVDYQPYADDQHDIREMRVAFLPAEATVGLKSNTANVGAITTTQTQVVGISIPANSLTVGSVYEFDAWGNVTSSAANTVTFRLRIGTTTLTGNIIDNVAPTATTTASNNSFHITGTVTVRSVGASGTIIGGIQFIGQDIQPFTVRLRASQATGTVAVDTTVANILELTAVTGGATTSVTFQQATIRCVMAS